MNKHQVAVLEHALKYQARGFSIIPVGQSKKPLIPWKQYQAERATAEQIKKWSEQHPDMGIAVVTGEISGIVVVDIEKDGSAVGYPNTVTANSGGGGWHLYYLYPNGKKVGRYIKVLPATDISGDNGYIILPPSLHPSGNSYEWLISPDDAEMMPLPQSVLDLVSKSADKKVAAQNTGGDIAEGSRNDSAAKFIGDILHELRPKFWETVAWPAAKDWNQTRCKPPLPDTELRSVYESISSRETSKQTETEEGREKVEFKPFTLDELYKQEFSPLQWLVEDLVPLLGVTALTGEPGSFKSYLTQSLAASIAAGTPFLGKFPTLQGKVLIVDEENQRMYMQKRFREMGVPATDNIIFLSQISMRATNSIHIKTLVDIIEEIKPVLIIMDSLTKVHDKDENHAIEMSLVFNGLKKLIGQERAMVLIHHSRKLYNFEKHSAGQNIRGSSNILAELECHLSVDKKGDTDVVITQGKLRIQQPLKPFKAALLLDESKNLVFSYQGESDERRDTILEATPLIKDLLESADDFMSIAEIKEGTMLDERAVRATTHQMEKDKLITLKIGPRGKHLYRLGAPEEAAPEKEPEQEEEASIEEIPF